MSRRNKALLVGLVLALGGLGASVAVAETQQSPVHVAPMHLECKVPTSEIPPASAHLTDAQIEALCNLPGAQR